MIAPIQLRPARPCREGGIMSALLVLMVSSATAEPVIPDDPEFPRQWALRNVGQVVEGVEGVRLLGYVIAFKTKTRAMPPRPSSISRLILWRLFSSVTLRPPVGAGPVRV